MSTEEKAMPRINDPEEDERYREERLKNLSLEKWQAILRLVGSAIIGGVASWRLFTYEPVQPVDAGIPWLLLVWIGLALLAFGLASWDQIRKVMNR